MSVDGEITVRALAPDDTVGIAELGDLTVRAYRAVRPRGSVSSTSSYIEALRSVGDRFGPGVTVLVAVDGRDHVRGGVTFVDGPASPLAQFDDPDLAGFRHLAVDPVAEGHGIGRRLVTGCLDRARAAGRRRVLIHTTSTMDRAQGLYADLGFAREPEHDRHTPGGTHLVALVAAVAP